MYKKLQYRLIPALLTATVFVFVKPAQALAACNIYASMTVSVKNVSGWSTTCTNSIVDGVDNGSSDAAANNSATLTFASNPAITIANGGHLQVGTITASNASITIQSGGQLDANKLTVGTGSISIQAGGQITTGGVAAIWVKDGDADGWPNNYQTTSEFLAATAAGSRRLGLMDGYATDTSKNDCNDAAFSLSNTCYSYAQSAYYGYGQSIYYSYSQSAYYGYGQGSYIQSY